MADAPCWNREVIKTMAEPFQPAGTGTAVLHGNLAPGGAVIKQSASSPHLLKHRGRALVFDSPADYYAVSNDPELDVDEDTVLVIRYCGPRGYPGMPEVSNVALPRKLLLRGVRDMVRICDGRMSGTAYGTVVLHVAPEAAAGGPLALVQTGDWIILDVPDRILTLEVSAEELAERQAAWRPPAPHASRGWTRLYSDHVLQADSGADLDFLVGASGHEVPRESHLPRLAAGSVHPCPFFSVHFRPPDGSTWRTLSCWTIPGPPAAPRPRRSSITPRRRCTWPSPRTCSTRPASSC